MPKTVKIWPKMDFDFFTCKRGLTVETLKSKLLLIIIVVPKKFDSEREIGSAIPNMAL